MIDRYSRPGMKGLWSQQARLDLWLRVELLAARALAEEGIVPREDLERIESRASFSIERCRQLERTLNHDVVAFTTNVAENIGPPASRWLHFGLTSSDVLDTAFAVQMVRSLDRIGEGLDGLRRAARSKALEHRLVPMIGRSHGIHAEPLTFGLKMALMHDEFGRAKERLEALRPRVAVGKISGAVGTGAHLSGAVEEKVCRALGLAPAPLATQVVQRDIHAECLSFLALTGCSIDRWATELRHLQRTEVLEAEESFAPGQKGSSAMPHKRNPISAERLCGLARVLRGNAAAAMENVALWHERDISHSSAERVIFPDSFILLDYMLDLAARLVEGLLVHQDAMQRNLEASAGLWHSQTVLLELVRRGMSREDAYRIVQRNAMETWKDIRAGRKDASFRERVLGDPEAAAVVDRRRLEEVCDLSLHLRRVDEFLRRTGVL